MFVNTYSDTVTESWGRTDKGYDSMLGECLCMLPKAEAIAHTVLCLKDVCLQHQGFEHFSRDEGPFVSPYLPSPSFHNRHLCLGPGARVRAQ